MSRPVEDLSPPWHPLTFESVARFASATLTRLLLFQVFFALLGGVSILHYALKSWVPAIESALERLPPDASLEEGTLSWPDAKPVELGANHFVEIVAVPSNARAPGRSAELHIELHPNSISCSAILGAIEWSYPRDASLRLDQTALRARWGAWKPQVLAGLIAGSAIVLMVSWWCLGFVYAVFVRGISFYADRDLSLGGAWRLSNAALLPGALLMSCSISLYATQRLPLIGLLFAFLLHFLIGWIYTLAAPLHVRRLGDTKGTRGNPFAIPRPNRGKSGPKNPFAGSPPQ